MNRGSREIYDEILVMRCKQHDLAAWNELVARWNDRLYYYLRRLIDNEQDAINCVQDVWLRAIRGIGALKDGSRLAPWLYTIARRSAITHYRRDYARHEETGYEFDAEEPNETAGKQLELENAEFIHFGLEKLKLPDREVLTLFFLEDLTIAEIATVLGVPPGTVKSRLFKARQNLRNVLEQEAQCHEG